MSYNHPERKGKPEVKKCLMPGVDEPVTWEQFISFVADMIVPFAGMTDKVGFCFSYAKHCPHFRDGNTFLAHSFVPPSEAGAPPFFI